MDNETSAKLPTLSHTHTHTHTHTQDTPHYSITDTAPSSQRYRRIITVVTTQNFHFSPPQ